jgi:hypothetical protein
VVLIELAQNRVSLADRARMRLQGALGAFDRLTELAKQLPDPPPT